MLPGRGKYTFTLNFVDNQPIECLPWTATKLPIKNLSSIYSFLFVQVSTHTCTTTSGQRHKGITVQGRNSGMSAHILIATSRRSSVESCMYLHYYSVLMCLGRLPRCPRAETTETLLRLTQYCLKCERQRHIRDVLAV
jgi:hypothetical protein